MNALAHDRSYLAKATRLYAWIRGHLFDPATGAVYDNVRRAASGAAPKGVTIERWKFTCFECSSAVELLELMGATQPF